VASTPPAVRRARRSLIVLLVIIAALVGVISLGVFRGEATWTPKLALDLQGGTQIILAPKQTDGQSVTGEQLQQAVSIIRQRVDASGVSEAEITTQGNQNIIVSIPGKADEATLARIEASAKMDMRAVLQVAAATSAPQTETDAADDTAADDAAADGTAADAEAADSGAADGTDAAADADTAEGDLGPRDPDPLPTNPSDTAWLTPALLDEFNNYVCGPEAAQEAGLQPLDRPLVTCDVSMTQKYILAPAEQSASGEVLGGESITDAVAQQRATSTGASTGEWEVALRLDSEGTELFGQMSTRLYGAQSPLNQFAFVLDGSVLIAPSMNGQILDGRPAISGNYTVESAKLLADQLKFGALPIGFTVQSQEDISATLGANQLQAGLLAGLIGLLLVVVYSIFQYRALGSVTILSLAIAGVLTYLLLTLFSWRQGYRLSLAGIAGIIVAVGFTAGVPHGARVGWHQLPRRADPLPLRGGQRAGLRLHPRPHDARRRARGRALHPPGGHTARAHPLLPQRASRLGPRPRAAGSGLPGPGAVPRSGHREERRRQEGPGQPQGGSAQADHRRAQGRGKRGHARAAVRFDRKGELTWRVAHSPSSATLSTPVRSPSTSSAAGRPGISSRPC